jgi:hypothetical protein
MVGLSFGEQVDAGALGERSDRAAADVEAAQAGAGRAALAGRASR